MSYENTGKALPYKANGKTGLLLKGDEYVHVDGLLTTKTPLLTEAQDVAGAINELFTSGGGGGDDWQPDPSWPEVPEPGANDVIGLIYISGLSDGRLGAYDSAQMATNNYTGNCIMDWGDGSLDTFADRQAISAHNYSAAGYYIFKHSSNTRLYYTPTTNEKLLIIKYGSNRFLQRGLTARHVQYISFFNPNLPSVCRCSGFSTSPFYRYYSPFGWLDGWSQGITLSGTYSLKKFECATKLLNIPENFLYGSGIETFESPNVELICTSAFSSCESLKSIFVPNCNTVGSNSFLSCLSLKSVSFSEGCAFDVLSFQNCYSLIVKPNGTF
jgi:hypothetical protein